MRTVETIASPRKAGCILAHPLRTAILARAREPISASELARRLGQPRQRVHYHVRQLAREGLLVPVGQQRKRNMVEQQYLASAVSYVIAPTVLGEAAATRGIEDVSSAEQLVAACAHAQLDVAQLVDSAQAAGVRVRTISIQTDVGFQSAAQRAAFTQALQVAVNELSARYRGDGTGRAFRLLVACYPVPADPSKE
jgi:DNA-binding transcriptional ArsR family regulator